MLLCSSTVLKKKKLKIEKILKNHGQLLVESGIFPRPVCVCYGVKTSIFV